MNGSNVLLVDEHRLQAQAVGGLLTQFCDLERLQVCTTVADALEQIAANRPDLLILDLHLPGERWQDAVEALARRNPDASLIILTANAADFVTSALPRGMLLAVIDKGSACDELLAVVAHWQRRRHGPRCHVLALQQQLDQLSPRELRVFEALGKGLFNREIAMALGLRLTTIATYRRRSAPSSDSRAPSWCGPPCSTAACRHCEPQFGTPQRQRSSIAAAGPPDPCWAALVLLEGLAPIAQQVVDARAKLAWITDQRLGPLESALDQADAAASLPGSARLGPTAAASSPPTRTGGSA